MNLKELKERKADLLNSMKDLTENVEIFDGLKFENMKAELEDVEDKISEFNNGKIIKNDKKESDNKMNKDFKAKLMSGKEINLSNEGEMKTEGNEAVIVDDYATQIEKKLRQDCVLYDRARKVVTASDLVIPVQAKKLDKFVKVAELGQYVKDQATFEQVKVGAVKYGTLVQISEELLEDNDYNLEAELMGQIQDAFRDTVNDLVVNGDMAEGVEGLVHADVDKGAGRVQVEAMQEIDEDVIIDLEFAMKRAYRDGAMFVINDVLAGKLAKLKKADGTPVLAMDFMGKPFGAEGAVCKLMDKECVIADLPEDKPLMFVNMDKAMVVGIRRNMTIKKSEEAGFLDDSVFIKANCRLDAKILMHEAIAFVEVTA